MDRNRFDDLARGVGRIATRRKALHLLAGATVRSGLGLLSRGGTVALAAAVGQTRASARKCKRCRHPCDACQRCKRGRCKPGQDGLSCQNDGNPCTDNLCAAGACTHPARANGAPCAESRICQDGECHCPAGTTFCDESCVNLATDALNCGSCGHRCLIDGVCTASTCDCALASCAGVPGATCCNSGSGGCICENAGTGFWAAPTNCGRFAACPPDTTPCMGPTCRACCPAGSTCDPGTGTCLQSLRFMSTTVCVPMCTEDRSG
jgi:hypothetical protein